MTDDFAGVAPIVAEHAELEAQLADPDLHADPIRARRVGRRYAELTQIVQAAHAWQQAADDLAAARELAADDAAFAEEVPALEATEASAATRLRTLLIPRDPDDGRDVILEVKAGEGGEESALFAADLARMYLHYAESKGWRTELLDHTDSDLGGYKDVQIAVKGSSNNPAEGVWAHLKYEGGVHRVQRVPKTEAQGRIHTSAVGVLVFPEVDAPEEVQIDPNDLKIDVFRSSGPGGQSVNTTDSAVRITHLPSGIVVSMQNEKSQLQNREAGMRVLRARLLAAQQEAAEAEASAARRSQVRTVDRSERIRTYNYPENRIADHRTGYKAYNLDAVLDGALEPIVALRHRGGRGGSAEGAHRVTAAALAGSLAERVRDAAAVLAAAGVPSPRSDAETLMAHVLGLERGVFGVRMLVGDHVPPDAALRFDRMVQRRAAREPLQHITGMAAFRTLSLRVGPGVFVPRPETESVVQIAIDALRASASPEPFAVDLGTGSGAIALAMGAEVPNARVIGVEREPLTYVWARENLAWTGVPNVRMVCDDLASALPGEHGTADVVISNPPYIPDAAIPRDVEVRRFDPPAALYGGEDGLDPMRAVVATAARLLHPGGLLVVEHGELQGAEVRALLPAADWAGAATHQDLTRRDRTTTALRR